jgi:hypothetical protein
MSQIIEGRVVRKTSNALQMTFLDGPDGEPMAVAIQGGADGKGSKLGVLLGFKNGGVGTHVLTFADGTVLHVKSGSGEPTQVVRADGVTIATIERGDSSVARAAGGTEIVRWESSPEGGKTLDAFRSVMKAPDGSDLGTLDVIRTLAGWSLYNDLYWEIVLGSYPAPLKIPMLGVRVELTRPLSDTEREVILAASVDMAIGLRPYVAEMR